MYKVVVVEDEDIIRKGLIYNIDWAELGCIAVAEARNGIEGIAVIKEVNPDIVVVDINMPVMDGLDMIRETYDQYDYAAIILSGYSNFEYAQKAIQFGVLRYLSKPIIMDQFKEAIHRAKQDCDRKILLRHNLEKRDNWRSIDLFKDEKSDLQGDHIIQKMLAYVYENYDKKIRMRDLVRNLNYSETFLNKKFREAVGTTYIEYLNRYRIQKAVEHMKEGQLSLQEIAWQCGIPDYKYFVKVFRKYVGCNPKEYLSFLQL